MTAKPATLQEAAEKHLIDTYRKCGNNKARTAEALGVCVKTVYNRLKRLERKGVRP